MEKETSTIEKFIDPSQWMIWKFQVRVNLMALEIFGHVDGTTKMPEPAAASETDATKKAKAVKDIAEWNKNDARAQKVIVNSCGAKILIHLCTCKTSEEMWSKLHSVYENTNDAAKQLLEEKYYSYKKDPSHDIATHISTLQNIVQKLGVVGVTVSESSLMTKILMTLPHEYRHFQSAWDSTVATDKTLINLTNRLMVEENRHGLQGMNLNEVSQSEALFAKPSGGAVGKQNQKHQKKKRDNKQKGKCFKCGSTEHYRKDCDAPSASGTSQKKSKGDKALFSEIVDSDASTEKPKCDGIALFNGIVDSLPKQDAWYQDSGATSHMCKRRDWFVTYSTLQKPIEVLLGNGTLMRAIGRGDMKIMSYDGQNWIEKTLKNVLYAPTLYANLFSSTAAMDNGHTSWSDNKHYKLIDDEETVAVGVRQGGMFQMLFKVIKPKLNKSMVNIASKCDSLRIWHERLGHQNLEYVRKFLKNNETDFVDEKFDCDGCAFGKLHRLSFKLRTEKSTKCGEIIHMDVGGPIEIDSLGGARYYVIFKDDYSHFRFVYFLKNKSEVAKRVENLLNVTEKICGHPVKFFMSDHGTEFINAEVKEMTDLNGILHRRSIVYTPEQNGCIERENRTIVESARSMIHAKGLDTKLWAEAVQTAVYVLNRTGTSTVRDKTPFELWYGKRAQFDHFHIFGSEVYVHIPKQKRKKMDSKAKKCIFVGYDEYQKGYRVMDEFKRISVARDVKFLTEEASTVTFIDDVDGEQNDNAESNGNDTTIEANDDAEIQADNSTASTSDNVVQSQQRAAQISKRRGTSLQDIDENNILDSRLRERANMAMGLLAVSEEPQTYQQAITSHESENWLKAMQEEHDSLVQNETWILVEKPVNQRVIDNKWVFKVKKNPDETIERYKARLVGRGFTQEYGIDYLETFSPVVRFDSLRAILALVAENGWYMKQFDVKTAFLNGELEEDVYMRQPVGFDDGSGRVCKLQKSLYGLKQASRCWNRKFKSFIERFGFKASDSDPCVFVSHQNNNTLILAIYVDDGLVVGSNKTDVELIIKRLQKEFEIKAMEVGFFLGFEIERQSNGSIFMHQTAYATRVLRKFRMDECYPVCIQIKFCATLKIRRQVHFHIVS